MTTKTIYEVERRQRNNTPELFTFHDDFRDRLALQLESSTRIHFPSNRWLKDVHGFFTDVLGIMPWDRQDEVINAYRDFIRVAVRSGHKVSKSNTAAGIALHFYCTHPKARVIMTSTTARQVDAILWREIRMLHYESGKCVECKRIDPNNETIKRPCPHSAIIDGEMGELARTGLKSVDFREIVGFTAREAEAVAGVSGPALLYILDEASGIKEEIFEAIEGNRAGGARVIMFSNPTRLSGTFFDAFNEKEKFYKTIHISSEETPNVKYGDNDPRAIPGLAGKAWVDEKREEWGEESALYQVRVKGNFADSDSQKIFSVHRITESEKLWYVTPLPETERLWCGFDPAGEGAAADPSVWCLRRGFKMLSLTEKTGQSAQSLLVHTLGMLEENRLNSTEIPVVCIDAEGEVGYKVHNVFQAFLNSTDSPPFELCPIRSSDGAFRNPIVYDTVRDELAANLLEWMSNGGAILEDVKLQKELNALVWVEQEKTGKVKLVSKKILRQQPPIGIGRSPGRYDALSLATWEPAYVMDNKPKRKQVNAVKVDANESRVMDPYANGMDPYKNM